MALWRRLCFLKNLKVTKFTSSVSYFTNSDWRNAQGLEQCPREYSPLTLSPDYSFLDGRPAPLSISQLRKRKYQENLCKKIVELSHELDTGLELYNEKKRKQKIHKKTILKNKLRPKGAALLKCKNDSMS